MMGKIRNVIRLLLAVAAVCTCLAPCAWAARFAVVALPDTQHYSQDYPHIFAGQTNWVKSNRFALGIAFVTHLGDITDEGWKDYQWANARAAMQVLNGFVPYGLCPGNHDLLTSKDPYTYDCTNFVTYFGPSYFSGYAWYGGASPSGFSSWQFTVAGGYSLLFIHLDVDAPDTEIEWARSVLSAHSGIPTILTTHVYMNTSGRYRTSPVPGRSSGETIWDELVRQYDQIVCVLCGHYFPSGYYRQVSINNSGRKVYEMLSDYQDESNGGNGWLRVITFDTVAGAMEVKTYSPYLSQYRTDEANQFAYHVNLAERFASSTGVRLLRPKVTSDFASGSAQGWTRIGDGASTLAGRSDADGSGYLYYSEAGSGTPDYFVAPAQFCGDLSVFDAIAFDYRVFTDGGSPDPTYIRLYSGSQYYQWKNTERVINNGQWERLVASLRDADLWAAGGGAAESFDTFITHITSVRLYADIVSGPEYNGLDNFSLAQYELLEQTLVASTFDNGTDGWTVDADGVLGSDSHGSITGTDLGGGGTWHFCAPAEFLGDKSDYLCGFIEFGLRQSKVDSQYDRADVVLSGGGIDLAMDLPPATRPDSSWTHYEIVLKASAGWSNQSTGLAPTSNEFLAVLSSLTNLRIRGEYRSGADTAWLDNVVMKTSTAGSDVQVTIGPPSVPATRTGSVSYRVSYTGASSINLTPADVQLNKTGTANGAISVMSGSNYRTVVISSITGNGTLGISIGPGTATGECPAPGAGPSAPVIVDNTAPGAVTVTDEGTYTPSLTTLSATWTPASDGTGSGIAGYQYAVGTFWGGTNVKTWTSADNVTSLTDSSLGLIEGTTYYLQVRAVDNVGLTGISGKTNGITVALGIAKIGLAWALRDSSPFSLRGKTVTTARPGAFWLEETDRSSAVKVLSTAPVQPGSAVQVAGVLGMVGSQRVMLADVVHSLGGGALITPVGLLCRDLGGSAISPITPGATGVCSAHNVGLLVRCWGRVVSSDSTDPANRSFRIDDGSSAAWAPQGLRVLCGDTAPPPVGSCVAATGVVGLEASEHGTAAVLSIWSPAVVQPLVGE